MLREVYVLGTGQTFFGKQPLMSAQDLGAQAAYRAIKDANVSPKDFERAYVGSVYSPPTIAQSILVRVGAAGIPSFTIDNACASGSSAVDLLWREISMGGCEVGIAIGVESLSAFNKKAGKGLLTTEGDFYGKQGQSTPSYFASLGVKMMEEMGATKEDLAYASVKNHIHGSKNPYAQYKKILSTEDILNSPVICDPLTAMMCCPQSDGAAAVILCSKDYYEKHKKPERPAVRIAASLIAVSEAESPAFNQLEMEVMVNGVKKACEIAGVGAEDFDCVELHDAFSNEELACYEMLGLCKKGEGISFARNGEAALGGKCPVNPSGGLLSMGHPLGASGTRVVGDIARQLWGEMGGCQVEGAKVGLAQMLGGFLANLSTSPICGLQILVK